MKNRNRWQSHIDREIEKAIQDGQIHNLPGAGKPLDLRDDPNTPDDMRLAYKVMHDNDVAPEWIMLGKALERDERKLRDRLMQAVHTYKQALAAAKRVEASQREIHIENAEKRWHAAQRTLKSLADHYNDQILTYNIKIPRSMKQRRVFDLQLEIKKALR